jgi:hypothetical protein
MHNWQNGTLNCETSFWEHAERERVRQQWNAIFIELA